jgi:PKD repeat protein
VQFSDLSSYVGATSWLWNFGDGQTSTLRNPLHTYTQNGTFTVSLTVGGAAGPYSATKSGYIVAGLVPPVPGVDNPSFEVGGGSLTGWEILNNIQGPDNPPWPNGTYGVSTSDGTHFGGKITSYMTMDFYMGQVIGASNWLPASVAANYQLAALAQLSSTSGSTPRPTNVHQVWEIGWNDDGSEPTSMMACDHYQTIASLDGSFNGNSKAFKAVSASGTVSGVTGLRGIALRVHFYNQYGFEWTHANIDAVSFTVTSAAPPSTPGDFDGDGDVDANDVLHLDDCRTSPGVPQADPACQGADLDHDGDVDNSDFGLVQRCLSGIDQPGNPNCAN